MYTVDNWIIATISAFVSLVATTAITAIVSTVIKKVVEKKLDASFKAKSAHLKEHDELMKMRADLEHKKRSDEILEAIRVAHIFSKKVYLTVLDVL